MSQLEWHHCIGGEQATALNGTVLARIFHARWFADGRARYSLDGRSWHSAEQEAVREQAERALAGNFALAAC